MTHHQRSVAAYSLCAVLAAATWPAFAAKDPAPPWATIGGYYVGMSKARLKALGTAECKDSGSASTNLTCRATAPIQVGGEATEDVVLTIARKTGRLEKIVITQFSATHMAVEDELVARFGPPMSTALDGGCGAVARWNKATDYTVHLCSWPGRTPQLILTFDRMPGLAKRQRQEVPGTHLTR